MRNFTDVWPILFNSHNKPLLGKLEFYEANTTSLKTIYDIDGSELLNPIFVEGVPETQVMLGHGDYDVKFYEYIGHGDMRHDEEYDHWFCYKTEYIKDNSIIADSLDTLGTVYTIDDLKNLKNMQDGDVIEVIGYYKKDDCPARYFIWHESGNSNDDGGITIKSNNSSQGYWLMKIPGTYVDVRWYGDIPSNFASASTSNESQRAKAATAANYFHKDLYFPSYEGGNALGFYMFTGSNTISVNKDIICDNGVRFVVKAGTNGTKVQCHEFYKCDKYLFISVNDKTAIGGYNLECNWIRTSWLGKDRATDTNARVGYIIDYLNTPLTLTDTRVKFERDGLNKAGCTFDGCLFEDCHKSIDKECTFKNMEIKQTWFADDFDFVSNCNFFGCTIKLDNFNDADTYIKMKNKQNEYDYGDLGEQSLNNALVYPGGTIENCYGSITLPSATSGEYEMHNCTLTINNITANKKFNLVDCWITVPSSAVCLNLSMRRGSIIVPGTNRLQVISNAYFNDVDIAGNIYAPGADCFITNSRISGHVTNTNIQLYDSIVTGVVESWVTEGKSIKFNVIGNTFSKGGYHYVNTQRNQGDTFDITCDGVWSNNTADYADKHWIVARRWGMGAGSLYMYTNNGQPYFDKMNRVAIKFYGICINVDTDHADKSRVRTDIPLVMFNKSERDFYFANFTVYAFSLRFGITTNRLRLSSSDAKGLLDQAQSASNAIVFSPASTLVPVPNSGDNFDYKFTSNELSPLTDIDHKYMLGARLGFANNATNIDYYTRSLSLWQNNMSSGLPAAVVNVYFDIEPNDVTITVGEMQN